MVLSRVRLIRVKLVLVNLNPINDTYIKDRDSFFPPTCVTTLVVKLVVVGGERNPASLTPSFRVRGRELEGNPASLAPGAGQGAGREEMSHSRAG